MTESGARPSSDPAAWGDPALLVSHPVDGVGRLDRVRGAVGRRRVVPTGWALKGTGLLYRTATRLLGGRRAAEEATMRAILPPGASQEQVSRLALEHASSMARAWELTWRPEALRRLPLQGREHLTAALESGRGILISYCHLGPELGWVRMSGEADLLVVLGEWIEEPTPPGYNGMQVEHRRTLLREAGFPLVNVAKAARSMLAVLNSGGAVLLAMDVPGPRLTRFLGKDVEMADGSARLAHRTGALVLPGAFVPHGSSWALRFLPPLDPADHGSWQDLHQALADAHSAVVEQHPEDLGSPLRAGFWGRADDTGWFREAGPAA